MYKKLFLIRHGNTVSNSFNIFEGANGNSDLTEFGYVQAQEMANKMRENEIEAIYCSPANRAIQTAKILHNSYHNAIPFFVDARLRELNFGKAEGKSYSELLKHYTEEQLQAFLWSTPNNWEAKFEGKDSESKKEAFERVYPILKQIVYTDFYNIAIVTHAGLLHSIAIGLNLKKVEYHNCAINTLYYDTRNKTFFT